VVHDRLGIAGLLRSGSIIYAKIEKKGRMQIIRAGCKKPYVTFLKNSILKHQPRERHNGGNSSLLCWLVSWQRAVYSLLRICLSGLQ
jgi:hypothetical protein